MPILKPSTAPRILLPASYPGYSRDLTAENRMPWRIIYTVALILIIIAAIS